MVIEIKDIKEKVKEFKNEFKQAEVTGFYLYKYLDKPNELGKIAEVKRSKHIDELVRYYNSEVNSSNLKYIALGMDYQQNDNSLLGSKDLCYEKIIS